MWAVVRMALAMGCVMVTTGVYVCWCQDVAPDSPVGDVGGAAARVRAPLRSANRAVSSTALANTLAMIGRILLRIDAPPAIYMSISTTTAIVIPRSGATRNLAWWSA